MSFAIALGKIALRRDGDFAFGLPPRANPKIESSAIGDGRRRRGLSIEGHNCHPHIATAAGSAAAAVGIQVLSDSLAAAFEKRGEIGAEEVFDGVDLTLRDRNVGLEVAFDFVIDLGEFIWLPTEGKEGCISRHVTLGA
jgi:hypothetical protein